MKVLFLFNSIYPDGMAMSKRLHLFGKGLIANGVHVDVVIPSTSESYIEGTYEGIRFSTFNDPVIFQNYILRQINMFVAAFFYMRYCFISAKKYEVILNPGFGWFTALLMIFGAHLGGAKVVMDVNENPYSPEGGRLDAIWIRKIRRQLTLNLTYRYADGVIVISESLEKLLSNFKKNTRIIKIPIITDKCSESRRISKNEMNPYILHPGALSETKDGVTAMFGAYVKACSQSPVSLQFILTSDIMHPKLRQKIDSILKKDKLKDRVIFKGHLPKNELKQFINSCTLAIINKPSNWQNDYNFPTKLGELLMAGVPLIVSKTGEMNKFLTDNETAFMVNANDVADISGKILYILKNPEIAFRVGQNGKKLALKEFYYLNHSDRLTAFFKNFTD